MAKQKRQMKRRDLLLALIALCSDRPEFGRTSLQKVAYFLGAGKHGRAEFSHQAHFYGPFSEVVETDVEALVLSGLVEEQARTLAFTGVRGPAKQYSYELTPAGRQRLTRLQDAYPLEFAELQTFVEKLEQAAGGLDQGILSPAAKTYFIANREGRNLTASEISRLARQVGWELRSAQIKKVSKVLDELGLVEVGSGDTGAG